PPPPAALRASTPPPAPVAPRVEVSSAPLDAPPKPRSKGLIALPIVLALGAAIAYFAWPRADETAAPARAPESPDVVTSAAPAREDTASAEAAPAAQAATPEPEAAPAREEADAAA